MSVNNKRRGYALEREVVGALQDAGLNAHRVFGGGAHKTQLGDDFAGDVKVEGLTVIDPLTIECKRRKNGGKVITDAFDQDNAGIVVFRTDARPVSRFWIFRENLALELLKLSKKEERENDA